MRGKSRVAMNEGLSANPKCENPSRMGGQNKYRAGHSFAQKENLYGLEIP
jgi:hypothetical protein